MPLKILCVYVLLGAAVGACASGGAGSASTAAAQPSSTRRDPNVITMEELADPGLSAMTVFDAIRFLRPNFLSTRGTQSIVNQGNNGSGQVHVSIDDSGVLPLDELKRLHVNGVVEIRLLSPAAAMHRFGGSAKEGPVIVVRTM